MTCAASDATRVCSSDGGGSDMDAPIKSLSLDPEFWYTHSLTGFN